MKFSEITNETAAERIGEMIEPASEIFSDTEFLDSLKKSIAEGAATALKKHSKAVIDILAAYDGIPREEYTIKPFQILKKLTELLKESDLLSAFTSQEQETEQENLSSTPVSLTITEEA